MPRLFISYRRTDSKQIAGRIYDRLAPVFGKENIFKDVDSIPPVPIFAACWRKLSRDVMSCWRSSAHSG